MESKNTVFARSNEWKAQRLRDVRRTQLGAERASRRRRSAHTLEDWYQKPSATAAQSRRMTLDDVVLRTASLFAVLLVGAGVGYTRCPQRHGLRARHRPGPGRHGPRIWAQVSKKVRRASCSPTRPSRASSSVPSRRSTRSSTRDRPAGRPRHVAAFAGMLLAYKTGISATARASPRSCSSRVSGNLVFGLVNLGPRSPGSAASTPAVVRWPSS